MPSDALRTRLLQARRDFFDRGAPPTGLVQPSILKSWQRCAERGFDSHAEPHPEPAPAAKLREIHQRNEHLLRHGRPVLGALQAQAKQACGIAILTDGAGLVLDAIGDPAFAGKAAGVALRPGVSWSEASTGTNAIGAALVEGRAITVHGAEHYFEPHRILTCAAAPLFDPWGRLIGALDLSGHAAGPNLDALSLIGASVDQIEHRMFADAFSRGDVVRLHSDPAALGGPREGVLVFEGSRLVAANRHGLRLLGLDRSAIGARSFHDLFDDPPQTLAAECRLRSRGGVRLHARVRRPTAGVPGARFESAAPAPPAETHAERTAPSLDAATAKDLARAVKLLEGDVPVLIQGETGSGKEVFARAVHHRSSRRAKPFVAVNCAALPEGLIEAELFGYEEGAFTGARRVGSKGLLREADGGVLLLDEIGDMPLALQARLLRVVQERAVTPLGGAKPYPVDIRLICATHRDLKALVAASGFRADLYYRVAQYAFALPPFRTLADRPGAILALWNTLPTEGRSLAPETLDRMAAYDWPGNQRELVGALKAVVALSEPGETIAPDLLPAQVRGADGPAPPPDAVEGGLEGGLEGVALAAMRGALAAAGGNVAEAARRLGVSRSTLYRRALRDGGTRRRAH